MKSYGSALWVGGLLAMSAAMVPLWSGAQGLKNDAATPAVVNTAHALIKQLTSDKKMNDRMGRTQRAEQMSTETREQVRSLLWFQVIMGISYMIVAVFLFGSLYRPKKHS